MNIVDAPMLFGHTLPYIEVGAADPIEEENLLEFRLLYQGELLPSGNKNTRPREKHEIRRALHPQLRRLWGVERNLRFLAAHKGAAAGLTEEEHFNAGIRSIGQQWNRVGYDFIPLVTGEHAVRCSLDILLLRPEEGRLVFTQGDIDGQVKTVFDALRMPASLEQAGGIGPQADETPFFVLLEDDKLISEVRVNSDQLLLLPGTRAYKANDAFVVIHVKLNHRSARTFDNIFG